MAAHDPSWDTFRAELKRWMELRRLTNKGLAAALNKDLEEAGLSAPVDEQIVKRWRHSTSPPLQSLKVIARILGMSEDPTGRASYDPTYLPRMMGLLDAAPDKGELIEAAYRLQSLRTQIADAQGTLAAATSDEGVVNILRAAVHAELGCAVLPVREGPPGYPMHVSDRLDLRSLTAQSKPDISEFPQLVDALHDAFAIRSTRWPRFSSASDEPLSKWAVPYLGRPRRRGVHTAHRGLPAIAITSVTMAPWIDDIGDIVAMVLGYGFTTALELARELVSDPYSHDALRSSIHENFLYEAPPQRRVWTHYARTASPTDNFIPFRDRAGQVSSDLVQFFVVEDDGLLQYAAEHPFGRPDAPTQAEIEQDMAAFVEARNLLTARAEELRDGQKLFLLPVTYRDTAESRWSQVFECVLSVLRTVESLGPEVTVGDVHERLVRSEPGVAPHILRWLADHEAPYVSPTYGTVR